MNGYVMGYGGKRYATNADNIWEAEEKLFNLLGSSTEDMKCEISQVESLEDLEDNTDIVFF